MKLLVTVGTRPNFVKAAALYYQIKNFPQIELKLVHTGQHYDKKLFSSIFSELGLPNPDYNLEIGSGSREEQLDLINQRLTPVLFKEKPNVVIVVGDVNSTYGCAKCAKDNGFKVAHIEAGLRSFDMEMPEEFNRIETDKISDFLFITEKSGFVNLENEKISLDNAFFVGNTMIDTLIHNLDKIDKVKILHDLNLLAGEYCVLTIHRPSNVDKPEALKFCLDLLTGLKDLIKVVFPVHPRTLNKLNATGLINDLRKMPNVLICEPFTYFEFIKLEKHAKFLITDSGGIQDETTYLNIPCITLRKNTERPITLEIGTSELCRDNISEILDLSKKALSGKFKPRKAIPDFWDGKAAQRILSTFDTFGTFGDNI